MEKLNSKYIKTKRYAQEPLTDFHKEEYTHTSPLKRITLL